MAFFPFFSGTNSAVVCTASLTTGGCTNDVTTRRTKPSSSAAYHHRLSLFPLPSIFSSSTSQPKTTHSHLSTWVACEVIRCNLY
ncbi:hypothetical protein I7I53_11803 [Histoplasma capsulatum var. duboisii H88]|uniref:Uncharacterized protein n=1 Tax=Ajellomyces capsulatus (strain H88) TaxID=544711 RepID=A0A8A1M066_AJEC8|nr:hypothetical protein I7I53_11803 [Histoplasma capsulatum var. duboisii H88]